MEMVNSFGRRVSELQTVVLRTNSITTANTGLAKVAVQCSASTFVVKIATFAKPETVIANY
jgi:hypothetical protein